MVIPRHSTLIRFLTGVTKNSCFNIILWDFLLVRATYYSYSTFKGPQAENVVLLFLVLWLVGNTLKYYNVSLDSCCKFIV